MKTRLVRLRFRRHVRRGQRQVEGLGQQAEQHIEQHLFRRFQKLKHIQRFLMAWTGLVLLLIGGLLVQNLSLSGYYQTLRPVPGGIYNEGVAGRFTNANPLYATSDADATVSHLIFAGLFTYDNQDRLVGNLASGYTVDEHNTTYTVHLKPHLTWQDGRPLTSSDVVFTYQMIQNPDAQSPLQSGWQGVTVMASNPTTVVFKLPNALAAFPYNLTNGIVPRHLLAHIAPADLRSADFNTVDPVGAGPFAWQAIQVTNANDPAASEEQIALTPFAGYQGGAPKLQKFVVQVFADQKQLAHAFTAGQLTGVEGLVQTPAGLLSGHSVQQHSLLLKAANMVFFRNSSGVLADTAVRQALVRGADVPSIIQHLGYATQPVSEPLLAGQLGYDPSLAQPGFDLKTARQMLDADGWQVGKGGVRSKNGQPLTFALSASDTPEYRQVSRELQAQWQQLGVKVQLQFQDAADFQNTVAYHTYDALLYGISIGVDPDVFVYWDSSQADVRAANRLNFSEWKNPAADTALEAGRTRLDPTLRVIKYRPFLQAWQQDAPALGLYQPRLLYLTHGPVAGLTDHAINTATDRLDNVQNWEIHRAKVTN